MSARDDIKRKSEPMLPRILHFVLTVVLVAIIFALEKASHTLAELLIPTGSKRSFFTTPVEAASLLSGLYITTGLQIVDKIAETIVHSAVHGAVASASKNELFSLLLVWNVEEEGHAK
jgi:hypothetical protein